MTITHRPTFVLDPFSLRKKILPLEPGDLIFAMVGQDRASRLVSSWQSGCGYVPLASHATHVALYLGKGEVAHAVLPRVIVEPVITCFLGRQVAVAGWAVPSGRMESRRDLGQTICDAAKQLVGTPYEWQKVIDVILRGASPRSAPPKVCSTFIDLVFDKVLEHQSPLNDGQTRLLADFVTPAHLFAQTKLL